jgi:hypothetical protein
MQLLLSVLLLLWAALDQLQEMLIQQQQEPQLEEKEGWFEVTAEGLRCS